MPLYEYQCEECGHRFELIQKYSDAPVATCPKCGGPVKKLFSSPAIQFKGSGFYITDYARAGRSDSEGTSSPKGESSGDTSAKKPAAESTGETKTEAKESSKSEAKTESKTESKSATKPSASKPPSD